jgi:hypothetical protein
MTSYVSQPIPITKESLEILDFNELSALYEKTINDYKSYYDSFFKKYRVGSCSVNRAYYWGNQINPNSSLPANSDFTPLVKKSFNDYLNQNYDSRPIMASNKSLGVDPKPGVVKNLYVDFTNNRGENGTISFPENSYINWDTLTNNNVWKNSDCSQKTPNNTCNIKRAYYWGGPIPSTDTPYAQSNFTSLVKYYFQKFITGNPVTPGLVASNDSLGFDPEYGVVKTLWIEYDDGTKHTKNVNYRENNVVNWNDITNKSGWATNGCKQMIANQSNATPPNIEAGMNDAFLNDYLSAFQILESNIDKIHNQFTILVERGEPNYFSNLDAAYKNTQIMNAQYSKLRDLRKDLLERTYKYQPALEVSSVSVSQSNNLYLLIFALFFITIFIFFYNYYGSLKSSLGVGQTGGARRKNYLLLFSLFVILAIILKCLS